MNTVRSSTEIPNRGQADPSRTQHAPSERNAKSVLVMTSEIPWPLNTGGHLRTFHLLRSLAPRFDVRLVVGVERTDDPGIEILRQNGVDVIPAVVGCRSHVGESCRILNAALHQEPYVLFRRHDRAAFRATLRQALRNHAVDVLYVDHLDPFAFRSLFPDGAKLLVDMHNVYSMLTKRVAEERAEWYARLYLAREARLLDKIERKAVRAADAVMAVSGQDQAQFEAMGGQSVYLVPNGVDYDAYRELPVGRPTSKPKILFLGALSWQPNVSAAQFLARHVLPHVRVAHPHAVLQIVGRNPGPEIDSLVSLPGVEIHANVPDVTTYFHEATLLAVPLDSGGGTRLKILEAFAAGLPVVSTPVGCEGIDARDGEHLMIRARDEFADGILNALENEQRLTELAAAARVVAAEQYDWKVIGAKACEIIELTLGNTAS